MKIILTTGLLIISVFCHAQQGENTNRLAATELAIPPSPIFDLMGVTPSLVNRTTDIKDFKVDWSFKAWKLNPNLAIQSQPIWELFYNRKDISKYQKANAFMRKLTTLDVSIGTVQNEENDRRIGGSVKMNLLKSKDPLLAKGLYDDIGVRYHDEKINLEKQLSALQFQLDTSTNILAKPDLRNQIKTTEESLQTLNSRRSNEITERAKIFVAENWNTASLDVAVGKVYTYQSDSAGSLKKLRLNRNTGLGVWLNGTLPIGKRGIVSGLIRTTWYEEELNFLLRDKVTQQEIETTKVAENKIYSLGLNFRYGSPIYSFFAEFLFERKALKTPVEALKDVFEEPANVEIVSSSVKWTPVFPNNISIGGDWRVSKNVIINYGMRWVLDKNGRSQAFIPVAGISCMMR